MLGKTIATVAFVLIAVSQVAQAEAWRDPVYRDMFNQPSFKYGEAPRKLPADSVPTKGKQVEYNRFDPKNDSIANPISQPTEASLEHGKFLFETYCQVCHGPGANGVGPMLTKGMPGPNLTVDVYKQKSDAFLWATILQGTGALMPGYAESMSKHEAWEVVNYVRSLQK